MTDQELIDTIPIVAHEAQAERYTRIIAHMAIGWCISVVLLAVVLLFAFSYEVETTEEIVTTEYSQEADNYGSNYISGGDLINGGEANSQENNNN